MRRVACSIAFAGTFAGALAACSLTTSLDGLSGGTKVTPLSDSGVAADAIADGGVDAPSAPLFPSCRALLAAVPGSKDGTYDLDPDGPGPKPPFKGYCDMTTDEGGWLRIDQSLLEPSVRVGVTPLLTNDGAGNLVLRIYGNIPGCSEASEHARDLTYVAPTVTWTKVRYKQTFAGRAACWTIAGGKDPYFPQLHRLIAFDSSVDVVRNAVKMGGTAGDAYDGSTRRCDDNPMNFWLNDGVMHSATFILRRDAIDGPAGLSTVADCGDFGAGTTSNTYWEYSDIYVR